MNGASSLAALRLLGLSAKGTQRVNAAETVVAALLGALLGIGEYWLLNRVMDRTGLVPVSARVLAARSATAGSAGGSSALWPAPPADR